MKRLFFCVTIILLLSSCGDSLRDIEILRNNEKVSESETPSPFGIVSLRTSLPDRGSMIGLVLRKVLGE
jgi:hypothetical protein